MEVNVAEVGQYEASIADGCRWNRRIPKKIERFLGSFMIEMCGDTRFVVNGFALSRSDDRNDTRVCNLEDTDQADGPLKCPVLPVEGSVQKFLLQAFQHKELSE